MMIAFLEKHPNIKPKVVTFNDLDQVRDLIEALEGEKIRGRAAIIVGESQLGG